MEPLLLLPSPASRTPFPPASARSCGGSHSITRLPAHTVHPPPFFSVRLLGTRCRSRRFPLFASYQEKPGGAEDAKRIIQELRVPDSWLVPSKALEEAEWLRVALHKWLDDEYCPEPMNTEISKVAAQSYYNSLASKETDMGEILLRMIRDLECLCYQDSFHGAFSAANAAINLENEYLSFSPPSMMPAPRPRTASDVRWVLDVDSHGRGRRDPGTHQGGAVPGDGGGAGVQRLSQPHREGLEKGAREELLLHGSSGRAPWAGEVPGGGGSGRRAGRRGRCLRRRRLPHHLHRKLGLRHQGLEGLCCWSINPATICRVADSTPHHQLGGGEFDRADAEMTMVVQST